MHVCMYLCAWVCIYLYILDIHSYILYVYLHMYIHINISIYIYTLMRFHHFLKKYILCQCSQRDKFAVERDREEVSKLQRVSQVQSAVWLVLLKSSFKGPQSCLFHHCQLSYYDNHRVEHHIKETAASKFPLALSIHSSNKFSIIYA